MRSTEASVSPNRRWKVEGSAEHEQFNEEAEFKLLLSNRKISKAEIKVGLVSTGEYQAVRSTDPNSEVSHLLHLGHASPAALHNDNIPEEQLRFQRHVMSTQQNSKFNSEQYAVILNFLEDPQNKAKVWGVPGKTEVGLAPPRKVEAWKELATIINNKFKGKYSLDHKSMADRWRTYMKKYIGAREKSCSTGFGVTDIDRKRNIHTVQAKLEMYCPHYERMHALVGDRPNITPAATFDSGSITSEVDLNELLRFTVEEVPNSVTDDAPIATEDSSGPHDVAPHGNETTFIPDDLVFSNEEEILPSPSPQNQARTEPEPEDDVVFPNDLEASPMCAGSSKRKAKVDSSGSKKSNKDRRKDFPTLSGAKNPTHSRNLLAQTIQESASARASVLLTIEEKRIKFEQMKWDAEKEEREVRRKQELEENDRRELKDEQRRLEDKEDERKRRAEDKAEKCRERRFALLQTMLADGKSADEIKEILAMLL